VARNATVYEWMSPEGHRLSVIVEAARVVWQSWVAGRGAVDPAEPDFTERTTVRSIELLDDRYVLNAGPDREGDDREWSWAAEQITRGVVPGKDYVLEPPGKRTANAANGTSKWSWMFMDVYDLAPGGVAWAPFQSESSFYEKAGRIAAEARTWVDAAHPEWRAESRRLGLEADLVRQREDVSRAQATIREARAMIDESRRRANVLRVMRQKA
jgi:hypothetical protein